MPVEGVLREACKRVGGTKALAKKLGVSVQAVYKFNIDGLSEFRVDEIARLTGLSRDRLRKFSEGKATERLKLMEL